MGGWGEIREREERREEGIMYIHAHQTYAHVHTRTHTHARTQTHTHTHTHTHVHTHTHLVSGALYSRQASDNTDPVV